MSKLLFFCVAIFSFANSFGQPTSGNFDVVTFEDLSLQTDTFWLGEDQSGYFSSNKMYFHNFYNEAWGYYEGWIYSNKENDTVGDFTNQHSVISASGYDPIISGGKNYAVTYLSGNSVIRKSDTSSFTSPGFFVNNTTYTTNSIENGDMFSKKFGGTSGNDNDWFKLSIWGKLNQKYSDTVEFFLADYRFSNNDSDYVIKEWTWVDLSPIGESDSLIFSLSSSDNGIYGMNTPAYFCMDNLYIEKVLTDNKPVYNASFVNIYPNPCSEYLIINSEKIIKGLTITDLNGKIILKEEILSFDFTLNVKSYLNGVYVLSINFFDNSSYSEKLLIKK